VDTVETPTLATLTMGRPTRVAARLSHGMPALFPDADEPQANIWAWVCRPGVVTAMLVE
jgi:hypothetical protein